VVNEHEWFGALGLSERGLEKGDELFAVDKWPLRGRPAALWGVLGFLRHSVTLPLL
jgi:hypothetical protein